MIFGNFDSVRIGQVIVNLISNSLKFGARKPIEIKVSTVDGKVGILVRDHGVGIQKEDQARIFGRFERATSVTNHGGLGLGLYISRQIIEAHHGKIEVESEPNQGATFKVQLPLQL
jgi:signal transduction histidine kinase